MKIFVTSSASPRIVTVRVPGPQGAVGPVGPRGFTGPTGPTGPAATVDIGDVNVVTPASLPTVTNTGSALDAIFDFELPRAPTFTVGAVTTGLPSDPAAVTAAADTNGDVGLNFTIPQGVKGDKGEPGNATTAGLDDLDDVVITSVQDGQVITFDAVSGDWLNTTLPPALAPVAHSEILIQENYTFPANYNGISAGPVTVDTGFEVTVPSGAVWVVVSAALTAADVGAYPDTNPDGFVGAAGVDARIAAASIDDLSDVDTSGVSDGDVLVYDSMASEWGPSVVTNAAFETYTEKVHDYGLLTGGTFFLFSIDLANGPVQTATLGRSIDFSGFLNVPTDPNVSVSVLMIFRQDSTGGRPISWFGSVDRWFGEREPSAWDADEEVAITFVVTSTEVRAFVAKEVV